MKTIYPLIEKRKSPFIFLDKMPDEADLNLLFSAASRAPSGFNRQPWRFMLALKGTEQYKLLLETLTESNQRWASTAPVLVLALSLAETVERGRNPYAAYEAGMAVGNLLVQAEALGLVVHQMGGYDKDLARKRFGLGANYELLTVMAIGYHGDPESLPEDLKDREARKSTRLGLDEIVFYAPLEG